MAGKTRGAHSSLVRLVGIILYSGILCYLFAASTAPAQVAGEPPKDATKTDVPPPSSSESPLRAPTKNEISVSGDFFYGQGTVTLPVFFSLSKVPDLQSVEAVTPHFAKPERNSDYFGATLSYSRGQVWYFDVSYAHGSSSGDLVVPLSGELAGTEFKITDDWYQAYVRYVFPLQGKRLSAYLRAGVTYVQADLSDKGTLPPPVGLYTQTDRTEDILGNVGFGLAYSLYTGDRAKLALQFEGEGFYGHRSQKSQENAYDKESPPPLPILFAGPPASIDNNLYGGLGRATVRFQYALGQSGLLKAFAEGGMQAKFTFINYSDLGTPDELLWRPYVKVGLRYSL